MDSINIKTFKIISTSIKSILNIANSIDDNKLLKNVQTEIEAVLDSVEDDKKESLTIKSESLKKIKKINNEIDEVNPPLVIKPLL
ncbi:hypothetical protein ACMC56_11470 [Campylobacterota bacterium DY0563]